MQAVVASTNETLEIVQNMVKLVVSVTSKYFYNCTMYARWEPWLGNNPKKGIRRKKGNKIYQMGIITQVLQEIRC